MMFSMDPLALYGAILSTVLAIVAGGKGAHSWWAKKKERRKLWIHMSELTIHNKSDRREFHMLPISVSNLAREPVIIREIITRGPRHAAYPGVFREPGAAYRIEERVLPKRLDPGATEVFCLFYASIFRSQIDEVVV